MSFIGQWLATGITPIPGGSVSFADQIQIKAEPAFGARLTLLRKDVVKAGCSAVINSTFVLTVKSASASSFTCSVASGGCSVSGATCPITCGAPGQLPDVTLALNGDTLLGTGFPQPESFRKVAAMAAQAEEEPPKRETPEADQEQGYNTWSKGFQ
jgi:hypothetical protein